MGSARLTESHGFSLIEVLVAALILVVGILSTLQLVSAANARGSASQAREAATNLAREVSENARTIPFDDLEMATLVPELQTRPQLGDAVPVAGWQIVRRGRTYTVVSSVCTIDGPGDGFGVHDGTYCADSEQIGTADPQPEDLKRVSTAVSFRENGRTVTVRFASSFSSSGQSSGFPVLALSLKTPTVTFGTQTEPVVTTTVTQLVFSAETAAGAARLVWSVDGQRSATDATRIDATRWSFTWPIVGLSDGSYLISAQTVDASGEEGAPREIQVVLARQGASPPDTMAGGFNAVYDDTGALRQVAELRWTAASDRNVTGYRLYRNGVAAPVCETSATATDPDAVISCVDFSPPAEVGSSDASRTYSVHSLYRDAGGTVRQSTARTRIVLPRTARPAPPANLAAVNVDGTVTIAWDASPSTVDFYRVYKNGRSYSKRVATPGEGLSREEWIDPDPQPGDTYRVTATSEQLQESNFIGPVQP